MTEQRGGNDRPQLSPLHPISLLNGWGMLKLPSRVSLEHLIHYMGISLWLPVMVDLSFAIQEPTPKKESLCSAPGKHFSVWRGKELKEKYTDEELQSCLWGGGSGAKSLSGLAECSVGNLLGTFLNDDQRTIKMLSLLSHPFCFGPS